MGDADIKIKISKDPSSDLEKGLKDAESAATNLVDKITDGLAGQGTQAISQFASALTGPLGAGLLGAYAAVEGLKKLLDFTLEAEHIETVHRSFENLAASAKLASQELEDGLIAASHGLADDEEILQASSRAVVQLGEKAAILPQVMELARKATAAFGGELVQNYEALNNAIATGNARAFRQFGIVVDADKAQKSYAATLGVTADVLTDSGKRSAIAEQALAKLESKLGNVDETALETTNSLKQFKVALQELGDQTAQSVQSSGFFASAFEYLKGAVDGTSLILKGHFGSAADQAAFKLRSAQHDISSFTSEIAYLEKQLQTAQGLDKSTLMLSLSKAQAGLNSARDAFAKFNVEVQNASNGKASGSFVKASAVNDKGGDTSAPVDQKALAAKRAQAQSSLQAMRDSLLAADEAYYAQNNDLVQRTADLDAIAGEKRLQIAADYDAKIRQLKVTNAQTNALTQAQLNEAEILLESEKAAKIAAIQNQSTIDYQTKLKSLQDGFKNTFASGISSSIQAFVGALAKGQNAFEAFGNAVLNMFGDLAIQVGEFFIAQGVAALAMKFLDPTGTIAAGAGLVALGSLLKAFSGGSSSASGGSVGASVASSAGTTASVDSTTTKAATGVTVNISGNLYNTKQTAKDLIDLINDEFSSGGSRLVTAS